MNCAEWSFVGGIPSILFTVTPDALHPSAESTAVTVSWKPPSGTPETTVSSPSSQLTHTTALVNIDGQDTLVSYWTFTFAAALTEGSRRHPYKVKFNSTAGIIVELVTEHLVLPSSY